MALKTYIKDSWYGGISEDDRLGGPNRFLYSENIDIHSNSNFIQLTKKASKACYTANRVYNLLEVTDQTTNNTKVLAFSEDAIYNTTSDTAVYSNSSLDVLKYPVFTLGDYVYWVRHQGSTSPFLLDRITKNGAMSSSWSSVTLGHKTLATNNYYSYWDVAVVGNIAWIALGDKVSKYNQALGTVEEFDIFKEQIAGITYIGGYFRVYTERGKLLLWDGTSDNIAEQVELGIRIERVKQIANMDYIITGYKGFDRGLYTISGYNLQPIFKERESQQISQKKFNFDRKHNNGCITNDKDTLYFIDTAKISGLFPPDRIAKFGRDIQGLPNAYSYISTKSDNGDVFEGIECLLFSEETLYAGFNDSTNKGVLKINKTGIETEGHIITNINDMQQGILRKTKHALYLKVSDIMADQYIEVYQSVDGGNYSLIHTINEQPLDSISRIPLTGDFRDISFKFVFKTSTSISPKIYYGPMIDYELHRN